MVMATGGIIGVVIGVVVGVIGLTVMDNIITNQAFTGTLKTVTDNIPILFAVGLLVLGVAWAYTR